MEALHVAAVASQSDEEGGQLLLRGPQTLQQSDATKKTSQPTLPTPVHGQAENQGLTVMQLTHDGYP